jgi:hypothetical protein
MASTSYASTVEIPLARSQRLTVSPFLRVISDRPGGEPVVYFRSPDRDRRSGRHGETGRWISLATRSITPGSFDLLGQEIVDGGDFRSSDEEESAYVAIVNEAFVERHLDGLSPLGRRLTPLVVRTATDPESTAVAIQQALQRVNRPSPSRT